MKPTNKEERMIQVGISFTPELLKKIDELRGREPRSSFVRRMLEKVMEVSE